jgi:hypothetical protein
MENIIMTFLEDKNVLGESQGAFRKNRRPEDHLFTLNGICSQRMSSKLKTYIAFLDLSKTFDRVWRDGLFYLLWKNGVRIHQGIYNFGRKRDSYVLFFKHI